MVWHLRRSSGTRADIRRKLYADAVALDVRRRKKRFEHFIGEEAPARSEPDDFALLLEEPALALVGDYASEVNQQLRAESRFKFLEIHAAVQSQAKKERFLQGGGAGDFRLLKRRAGDVSFERVGGCEADRLDCWRGRKQHGMRVDAESEIRPACPVL